MASLSPLHQFAASVHFSPPTKMALRTTSPFHQILKGHRSDHGPNYLIIRSKSSGFYPFRSTRSIMLCTINMTAGESDVPQRLNLDHTIDEARRVWESFPPPVKTFPWITALENILQLVLDLFSAVVKYLSLPVLTVSSLSEMSYCAHERKMALIPIPLLAGIAVAGILRDTALELSPSLKEREFPWHLAAIAIVFTLLKLLGPYYPYWGRILIPHFANGGLLRTIWFGFMWFKAVRGSSETT